MKKGTFIQIHLVEPREQWFGRLFRLNEAGILMRGIEIRMVETFKYQFQKGVQEVFPQSVFFPMRRVERVYADEPLGDLPSMLGSIIQISGLSEADLFTG